ncbi:tail fiber domain-containing protein [Massilia sp. CT11-137]|uniref:tail fiber domain-containing protein n=1 Tax=Massilia sp. CT11-137 TaxID=3393901 RepID=UPI0039A720CF
MVGIFNRPRRALLIGASAVAGLFAKTSSGETITTPTSIGKQQYFFPGTALPLANGKLYTYAPGTSTPKPTFKDAARTIPNANPVILDSTGSAFIFWTGNYKIVLKDARGNTVDTLENYSDDLTAALQNRLGQPVGASLIGFIQAGIGAVARTVREKLMEHISITDFMTDAQRADAKAYTFSSDMTGAFSKAMDHLVKRGGGRLFLPLGGYRLEGKPGSDGFKDGILIPSIGGATSTRNGIIIEGEGAGTILRAYSSSMIVVRNARLFSSVRDLQIDGNGAASTIGYGSVPQSIEQTTTFTSQSYQTVRDVFIENCAHQIMLQPGPTVGGSDSGGFYHRFENVMTNKGSVHDVWFRPDPTGANNRTTRTTFENCKFLRGKDSIYIQAATEIDFISCWWELWTGTMLNYVPAKLHAANIRLIGGYGESSGPAIGPIATTPAAVSLIGFAHNRPPTPSEYMMIRILPNAVNIAKMAGAPARLSMAYPGFVDLVADPDGSSQKTCELQINGAGKERWAADGSKTFFGTQGNVKHNSNGAEISFTRTGRNYLSAYGAGAALIHVADYHGWNTAAGGEIASLTSKGLIPRQDNSMTIGDAGFRWKEIFSGTGTINTSDERDKEHIEPIPTAWLEAWAEVQFYRYKFKDAVALKGDGARWHIGVVAQRVKEAFEARGIDPFDIGLLCYDEWDDYARPVLAEREGAADDGTKSGELYETDEMRIVRTAGSRYGIRYEEALALECAYLRSRLSI